MIKKLCIALSLLFSVSAYAQYDIIIQYRKADSLMKADNYLEAYRILRKIEPVTNKKDSTLYPHILWDYTVAISVLEKESRLKEDWRFAISYANEALGVINKGRVYFEGEYLDREFWMYKNIIVAYFGLGYPEKAKEYQDKLYAAYKAGKLPPGMEEYYNFEFFKWNGNNVWAYEWFANPGDSEATDNFPKIAYYVYSTNPDGSDKDQLYRIELQKFQKTGTLKFDYVLNKQLETATNEVSGPLFAYTYKAPINYHKLRADIRKVLSGVYEPPQPPAKPSPKPAAKPASKPAPKTPAKKKS